MIRFESDERKPKARRERKTVTVRLAPEDFKLLNDFCNDAGRTYGEFLALLLNSQKQSQVREAAAH